MKHKMRFFLTKHQNSIAFTHRQIFTGSHRARIITDEMKTRTRILFVFKLHVHASLCASFRPTNTSLSHTNWCCINKNSLPIQSQPTSNKLTVKLQRKSIKKKHIFF